MKKIYFLLVFLILGILVACSDDDKSTTPTDIYQADANINTSDGNYDMNVGFSYYDEDDNTTTIYLTDANINANQGTFFGGNYVIINLEGSGTGTYNISSNGDNQLICLLEGNNRVALNGTITITEYGSIGNNISGNIEVSSFLNDNSDFQINSSSFVAQRIDEYLLDDDDDDGGGNGDNDIIKSLSLTGNLPNGSNVSYDMNDVVSGSAGYFTFSGNDLLQIVIELNPEGTNDEMVFSLGLSNTDNQESTITFEEGNFESNFTLSFNNAAYRFFGTVEIIEAAGSIGDNYRISFDGDFINLSSPGSDFTNVNCQFVIERQS